MKKTLTVNLNNIVFHIDDDAYEMLQTYLYDIADHFQAEDEKQEIMNDVEARISEIFSEKLQKNKNVINLVDVQEVIDIMGKPSQYADEDEEAQVPKSDKKGVRHRRFYRDPENAVLGGVAAGLSAYFNMDVTVVRILLVVLTLIVSGFIIPAYLVVWLVAPQAVTAGQRLEMQGENVTVENIKSEFNNAKNYVQSDKFKESATSVGTRLGEVFRVVMKVVFSIVGVALGILGVVSLIGLLLFLSLLIFNPALVSGFASDLSLNFGVIAPDKLVMLAISILLVVGCPVFMLIYWLIRAISGRSNYSKTTSVVVLILWLAGLFMFCGVGTNTIFNLHGHNGKHVSLIWSDRESPDTTETRTVEAFSAIDVSGNIEVVLVKDSIQELTVEAEENSMPRIITRVENGVLHIYSDDIVLNRSVKVTVPVDSLNSITCSGASRVNTGSELKSAELKVKLSGASQVDLNVQVNLLDMEVSGASQADINGAANSVKIEGSGASRVDAEELIAKIAYVKVTGASHAEVYASERLDATSTGASRVNCSGSPKQVNRNSQLGASIDVE